MPRGGIWEKINNIGRGPRERCRSVPRGARSPLFYLRHFFPWCLILVPRSLLLNRVALCHGVASKKKKESVADQEGAVSLWATVWR